MLVFIGNLILTVILFALARYGIGGDIIKTLIFAVTIVAMCLLNYIDGRDS